MKWFALILTALSAAILPFSAAAETRIRDIVDVEGIRQNDLVGYGIVVGLNGTGDTVKNSPFTEDSLSYMLERLGVNVQGEEIKPKNVAAVLVTATLPSFARSGSSIDVTVASIGDAKSLEGGTLILTPLKGADNEVYPLRKGRSLSAVLTFRPRAHGKRAAPQRPALFRMGPGSSGSLPMTSTNATG
jgi:flagellar P-ring protein precursor FlgI